MLPQLQPIKTPKATPSPKLRNGFSPKMGNAGPGEDLPLLAAVLPKEGSGVGTSQRPSLDGEHKRGYHKTAAVIVVWYACNMGLVFLNKFFLSNHGFSRPIFLTLCHMVACFSMSSVAAALGLRTRQKIKSQAQMVKIATLAVVFCLAVVLGNVALRFIPVSFSEAIGATTPAWTAVIAFLLLGSTETALTYATLCPVILGIVMAVGGEPSFHMFGLVAAFGSTASRALKSVLQGALLSGEEDRMGALNLLHWMSIVAIVVLLPTTIALEPGVLDDLAGESPWFLAGLFFNSLLAYFVNLTNFLVTRHTSALTLQVLGNAKGVLMVALSISIFKNDVSASGMLGYGIAVFGVAAYAYAKHTAALKSSSS